VGVWMIDAYPDSKTVTPPKLPDAASATIKGTLDGAIGVLSDPNPKLGLFTRVAFSRRFKVTK
jgi:hypothetical protein